MRLWGLANPRSRSEGGRRNKRAAYVSPYVLRREGRRECKAFNYSYILSTWPWVVAHPQSWCQGWDRRDMFPGTKVPWGPRLRESHLELPSLELSETPRFACSLARHMIASESLAASRGPSLPDGHGCPITPQRGPLYKPRLRRHWGIPALHRKRFFDSSCYPWFSKNVADKGFHPGATHSFTPYPGQG